MSLEEFSRKEKLVMKEHRVPSEDGYPIPVWEVFDENEVSKNCPTIVYAHGGGFIKRPINMKDAMLDRFRIKQLGKGFLAKSGFTVFYVSYRLAQEKPFPAPANDVYAAYVWAITNASDLGIDKNRVGFMGCSAGGNLALHATLRARDDGIPPCGGMYVYPMTDPDTNWENPKVEKKQDKKEKDKKETLKEKLKENLKVLGEKLTGEKRFLRSGWEQYHKGVDSLPEEQRKYAKLLLADFSGLPRTYVDVGTEDFFCKEDKQLMEKLAADGVSLTTKVWEGVPHAFEGKPNPTPEESKAEREALQLRYDWWQTTFQPVGASA
ncbi:Alpha/Beta hydrolase protein [Hypoxylon rubiginosum]|uniref:Alpha/Beta hydrolase protein n=1 Tax=Hypoxylon rubiginosum TaxID=110542 RepID=A0ACC0CU09_9PEZI|nr:Alpha/Beta hydrolase protein [Hypoxylon rubiginosum]